VAASCEQSTKTSTSIKVGDFLIRPAAIGFWKRTRCPVSHCAVSLERPAASETRVVFCFTLLAQNLTYFPYFEEKEDYNIASLSVYPPVSICLSILQNS
jgi:hypothetical protein